MISPSHMRWEYETRDILRIVKRLKTEVGARAIALENKLRAYGSEEGSIRHSLLEAHASVIKEYTEYENLVSLVEGLLLDLQGFAPNKK